MHSAGLDIALSRIRQYARIYPSKRIFQYCSGYWWVIVLSDEYQGACREYLFICELSMQFSYLAIP